MTSSALVALDMDGTILAEDEKVRHELAEFLRLLDADPEFQLVFATGRAVDAAVRVVNALGLQPEWIVACNGAVTLARGEDGEFVRSRVLTFDPAPMLRHLFSRLPHAAIAVEAADGNFYYTEEMPGKTLPDNRVLVDFERLLQIEATRVVATSPVHSIAEFFAHMDELGYAHTAYVVGDTAWLDAAPQGVNKATALEPLAKAAHISGERIFAAGDGLNDLEMLKWVAGSSGMAVAMAGSPEDLCCAANFITGSLADNGVLMALRQWEPAARLFAQFKS